MWNLQITKNIAFARSLSINPLKKNQTHLHSCQAYNLKYKHCGDLIVYLKYIYLSNEKDREALKRKQFLTCFNLILTWIHLREENIHSHSKNTILESIKKINFSVINSYIYKWKGNYYTAPDDAKQIYIEKFKS